MSKEELKQKVFESLGYASMCWSETPKGVFESNKAKAEGEKLFNEIEAFADEVKPKWVSTLDSLPDINVKVLVFKKNVIGPPYIKTDFMQRDSHGNIFWMYEGKVKYTHWMPLPDKPLNN